jgi:hypothetical protein
VLRFFSRVENKGGPWRKPFTGPRVGNGLFMFLIEEGEGWLRKGDVFLFSLLFCFCSVM